jgi:predicted nucleic acid-binding Zn ribbon protein
MPFNPFYPPHRIPARRPPKLSAGESALAAWRGTDASIRQKAVVSRAKAVSELLPRALEKLQMDQRRAEVEIVKVWNHLMDPVVVAHAQPSGLHKGTLFVSVDSSVWLCEIVRYRRKEILDRLRHSFGPGLIARVSYRVG